MEKENADGEKGTQRDSDSTNAHSQRRSPGDLARRGQPENAHADHEDSVSSPPAGRQSRACQPIPCERAAEQSEDYDKARGRDYYYDHGGETNSENFPA